MTTNQITVGSGDVLGVVGGMGPLASAEFLKTIYEASLGSREQDSPVVLLYSDPTFPDRTSAFLAGEEDAILEQLVATLLRVRQLGATRFVLCCMTVHHLIPRLPAELAARVVSLMDVIFARLGSDGERHLLLCTDGTRQLGLFQRHPAWERVAGRVVLPDAADQRIVHDELIYAVKRNVDPRKAGPVLERLLHKYGVSSFVAGCTEVHIMGKHFFSCTRRAARFSCVDPLVILAGQLAGRSETLPEAAEVWRTGTMEEACRGENGSGVDGRLLSA